MKDNKYYSLLILALIFCVIGFALTSNPNREMKEDTLITGNVVANSLTGFAIVSFPSSASCPSDRTILTISALTDAHAALSGYGNAVCAVTTGAKTCDGNNTIGYVYPVAEQGHFSVTPNSGWTQVCYGNLKCTYGNYPINCAGAGAGYECVLSYTNGEPTDAHVGDCSASNAGYGRVCCKGCSLRGEPCSTDSDCCGIAENYDVDQHCSDSGTEKRCCPKGSPDQEWNGQQCTSDTCLKYYPTYTLNEAYDTVTKQTCCRYGIPGNYYGIWCDVTVYTP